MIYLLYALIIFTIYSLNFRKLDDFFTNTKRRHLIPSFQKGDILYNKLITICQTREFNNPVGYKFYDSLIIQVIDLSKSLGSPLRPVIAKIKKALLQDIKIEKEIKNLKVNSYLTFLFSSIVTWLFLWYCKISLNLNFNALEMFLVLIWQTLGFLTYIYFLKILLGKALLKFEVLIEKIYIFDLAHSSGLSMAQVLEKTDFSKLNIKRGDKLSIFIERLRVLIDSKQRFGMEIANDLDLLIDEVWAAYGFECEALRTKVTIIKFVWLCLFFLSTYLFSLYSVFGQMIY